MALALTTAASMKELPDKSFEGPKIPRVATWHLDSVVRQSVTKSRYKKATWSSLLATKYAYETWNSHSSDS
jgi:hypothetical protein